MVCQNNKIKHIQNATLYGVTGQKVKQAAKEHCAVVTKNKELEKNQIITDGGYYYKLPANSPDGLCLCRCLLTLDKKPGSINTDINTAYPMNMLKHCYAVGIFTTDSSYTYDGTTWKKDKKLEYFCYVDEYCRNLDDAHKAWDKYMEVSKNMTKSEQKEIANKMVESGGYFGGASCIRVEMQVNCKFPISQSQIKKTQAIGEFLKTNMQAISISQETIELKITFNERNANDVTPRCTQLLLYNKKALMSNTEKVNIK